MIDAMRRHWRRRWRDVWSRWGLWWLICLGAGIGLAVWSAQSDRLPGDVDAGRWIQDHDPFGQAAVDFFRDVGSTVAATVTIIIVALFLAWTRRPRMAAAALVLLLGLAWQGVLKDLVDRPRTSVMFLEQRAGFDSESFPSGHAMSSTIAGALVVYTAWRVRRPWRSREAWRAARVLAAGWGLAVATLGSWVSVTGGVHWPSDVVGGVVWAAVWLIPVLVLLERGRLLDRSARHR